MSNCRQSPYENAPDNTICPSCFARFFYFWKSWLVDNRLSSCQNECAESTHPLRLAAGIAIAGKFPNKSSVREGFLTWQLLLLQLTLVACYGDLSRSRLTAQAEHNLAAITKHAMVQATELVDSVVDDLLVLDSQNPIILSYLSNFEAFLVTGDNHTKEALQSFYNIVGVYLDADVAEKTSSIEIQLIAMCLQRTGFDRWKRTIQMRSTQLLKSFGKKLKKYMDTLDPEERLGLELRWKRVISRGGQRKLEKFRDFVTWLAR